MHCYISSTYLLFSFCRFSMCRWFEVPTLHWKRWWVRYFCNWRLQVLAYIFKSTSRNFKGEILGFIAAFYSASSSVLEEDKIYYYDLRWSRCHTGVYVTYLRKLQTNFRLLEQGGATHPTHPHKSAPVLIQPNPTFFYFRSLKVTYDSTVTAHGIDLYRFTLPKEALENGDINPDNKGFCVTGATNKCLPSGLLDVNSCKGGHKGILYLLNLW
jgi:hypothetical protein